VFVIQRMTGLSEVVFWRGTVSPAWTKFVDMAYKFDDEQMATLVMKGLQSDDKSAMRIAYRVDSIDKGGPNAQASK